MASAGEQSFVRSRSKRGPSLVLSESEKKKRNSQRCRTRRQQCVFIGTEIERWNLLKSDYGMANDQRVAKYLLNLYYYRDDDSRSVSNSPKPKIIQKEFFSNGTTSEEIVDGVPIALFQNKWLAVNSEGKSYISMLDYNSNFSENVDLVDDMNFAERESESVLEDVKGKKTVDDTNCLGIELEAVAKNIDLVDDMNFPETELGDMGSLSNVGHEMSCSESYSDAYSSDDFNVSNLSDVSSNISEKLTQKSVSLRRSSRSCVKKVNKKIKLIAKTLAKIDKNEQSVEENESGSEKLEMERTENITENDKDQILKKKHNTSAIKDEEYFPPHISVQKKRKAEKIMESRMLALVKFERLDDGTFQCTLCQDIFSTDENEEEHCSKHLGLFKCNACDELLSTETVLKSHQNWKCAEGNLNKTNNTFQCKFCSFSCDLKQPFCNHMRTKHNDDSYSNKKKENAKFPKMLSETGKKRKLASAMFARLVDGTFQCTLCQTIFASDENKEEHCTIHLGVLQCSVCCKFLATETSLKAHQNGKKCDDKINDTFHCKHCSFSCDLERPFSNHMKKKHYDESYEMKNCLCDACGLAFNNQTSLTRHACTSKSRMWLCSECGEQFTRYYDKKKHCFTHNEKNVKCCMEDCVKMFYTPSLMLQHYRQSHQLKKLNFVCTLEHCGKRFSHSNHLNQHINSVHERNRLFICHWPDCSKRFTNTWNLKVHMRIHKGENPIECQFCDYSCRQRAALNWHLRKHGIFNREQETAALEKLNTKADTE